MTKVTSTTHIAVRLIDDDLNPHDVNIPPNTPTDVPEGIVRHLVALGASIVPEPDATNTTASSAVTSTTTGTGASVTATTAETPDSLKAVDDALGI